MKKQKGEKKMELNQFIGKNQLSFINGLARQREYFKNMILKLKDTIKAMPKSYETDGQGDEAIATLHYFKGGSDWYIIEKDTGSPDDEIPGVQIQAFGFVCLNGDTQNAEFGYISIEELIRCGVELDLYYKPEKIGDIKKRLNI